MQHGVFSLNIYIFVAYTIYYCWDELRFVNIWTLKILYCCIAVRLDSLAPARSAAALFSVYIDFCLRVCSCLTSPFLLPSLVSLVFVNLSFWLCLIKTCVVSDLALLSLCCECMRTLAAHRRTSLTAPLWQV